MTDDDLDRHLLDILDVRAGSGIAAARDRLRLAIDGAVRAELEACVEIIRAIAAPLYTTPDRPPMYIGNHEEAMIAAIRNRSNPHDR